MVEWTEYNPDEPPKKDVLYLVAASNRIHIARFLAASNRWINKDLHIMKNVTHYAAINRPEGDK